MESISIDIGYGSTKVSYSGKVVQVPTAVAFSTDVGMSVGDNKNVYEYKGDSYIVGKEAINSAFDTTSFNFIKDYAGLIIYHILSKFEDTDFDRPIQVNTGLAITDYGRRQEFLDAISVIEVDGRTIHIDATCVPQGAGIAIDWTTNNNNGEYPELLTVIDIGFNTVGLICFEDGRPVKSNIKGFPGAGVTTIVAPLKDYLENTYSMKYTTQEALKILKKGKYKFNGEDQPEITTKIEEFKRKFIKTLFNSILVSEKKLLATSDAVVIGGGGAYFIESVPTPPNVVLANSPYEFSNVSGYSIGGK